MSSLCDWELLRGAALRGSVSIALVCGRTRGRSFAVVRRTSGRIRHNRAALDRLELAGKALATRRRNRAVRIRRDNLIRRRDGRHRGILRRNVHRQGKLHRVGRRRDGFRHGGRCRCRRYVGRGDVGRGDVRHRADIRRRCIRDLDNRLASRGNSRRRSCQPMVLPKPSRVRNRAAQETAIRRRGGPVRPTFRRCGNCLQLGHIAACCDTGDNRSRDKWGRPGRPLELWRHIDRRGLRSTGRACTCSAASTNPLHKQRPGPRPRRWRRSTGELQGLGIASDRLAGWTFALKGVCLASFHNNPVPNWQAICP